MSDNLYPSFANFNPSKNACFVTETNFLASSDAFPTINVLAQSPWYPFLYTTKSILIISPSFNITFLDGIPCITSSLIEIMYE